MIHENLGSKPAALVPVVAGKAWLGSNSYRFSDFADLTGAPVTRDDDTTVVQDGF